MALTRKFLVALDIDKEKIEEIIEAHSETVEALKAERDGYKADADALSGVKSELAEANKKIAEYEKAKDYKADYDSLKDEFDKFKAGVDKEKTDNLKSAAYKKLLKEVGISEKHIDAVARLQSLDELTLDKDGNIEKADEVKKARQEEFSEFMVKDGKEGAGTATPPGNIGGGKLTKDQIFAIKDTAERQQAMLENKELFLN